VCVVMGVERLNAPLGVEAPRMMETRILASLSSLNIGSGSDSASLLSLRRGSCRGASPRHGGSSPPTPSRSPSSFAVSHARLLNGLDRLDNECAALKRLLLDNHDWACPLAVLTRCLVHAADGWAPDRGVVSVMVVEVKPVVQRGESLGL
jgi:hypothetical protein